MLGGHNQNSSGDVLLPSSGCALPLDSLPPLDLTGLGGLGEVERMPIDCSPSFRAGYEAGASLINMQMGKMASQQGTCGGGGPFLYHADRHAPSGTPGSAKPRKQSRRESNHDQAAYNKNFRLMTRPPKDFNSEITSADGRSSAVQALLMGGSGTGEASTAAPTAAPGAGAQSQSPGACSSGGFRDAQSKQPSEATNVLTHNHSLNMTTTSESTSQLNNTTLVDPSAQGQEPLQQEFFSGAGAAYQQGYGYQPAAPTDGYNTTGLQQPGCAAGAPQPFGSFAPPHGMQAAHSAQLLYGTTTSAAYQHESFPTASRTTTYYDCEAHAHPTPRCNAEVDPFADALGAESVSSVSRNSSRGGSTNSRHRDLHIAQYLNLQDLEPCRRGSCGELLAGRAYQGVKPGPRLLEELRLARGGAETARAADYGTRGLRWMGQLRPPQAAFFHEVDGENEEDLPVGGPSDRPEQYHLSSGLFVDSEQFDANEPGSSCLNQGARGRQLDRRFSAMYDDRRKSSPLASPTDIAHNMLGSSSCTSKFSFNKKRGFPPVASPTGPPRPGFFRSREIGGGAGAGVDEAGHEYEDAAKIPVPAAALSSPACSPLLQYAPTPRSPPSARGHDHAAGAARQQEHEHQAAYDYVFRESSSLFPPADSKTATKGAAPSLADPEPFNADPAEAFNSCEVEHVVRAAAAECLRQLGTGTRNPEDFLHGCSSSSALSETANDHEHGEGREGTPPAARTTLQLARDQDLRRMDSFVSAIEGAPSRASAASAEQADLGAAEELPQTTSAKNDAPGKMNCDAGDRPALRAKKKKGGRVSPSGPSSSTTGACSTSTPTCDETIYKSFYGNAAVNSGLNNLSANLSTLSKNQKNSTSASKMGGSCGTSPPGPLLLDRLRPDCGGGKKEPAKTKTADQKPQPQAALGFQSCRLGAREAVAVAAGADMEPGPDQKSPSVHAYTSEVTNLLEMLHQHDEDVTRKDRGEELSGVTTLGRARPDEMSRTAREEAEEQRRRLVAELRKDSWLNKHDAELLETQERGEQAGAEDAATFRTPSASAARRSIQSPKTAAKNKGHNSPHTHLAAEHSPNNAQSPENAPSPKDPILEPGSAQELYRHGARAPGMSPGMSPSDSLYGGQHSTASCPGKVLSFFHHHGGEEVLAQGALGGAALASGPASSPNVLAQQLVADQETADRLDFLETPTHREDLDTWKNEEVRY
eukprot:g5463.t1